MGNWSESLGNPSSIQRRISCIRDTWEKGDRITSIFTSISGFLGVLPFGVPLTWLWALSYLSCPSASVPSSTWSDAHTLSIISSFTPYLHSPSSTYLLVPLISKRDYTRATLIFKWPSALPGNIMLKQKYGKISRDFLNVPWATGGK